LASTTVAIHPEWSERVKFGVCCPLGEVDAALEAGFDYVELGASGFEGLSDDWNPEPYLDRPILATNLFFDSRVKLFEPCATPYMEYVTTTLARAVSLRVPVMVIGSGASRYSMDPLSGNRQFVEIVARISNLARHMNIVIAPESLNRTETNVGNDLRTLALSLREVGAGYTADSYHILFEWDADGRRSSIDELYKEQIPFAPSHVHIANLPRTGVDAKDPMLQGFADRLRELSYGGNVSLECDRPDSSILGKSLEQLHLLFR
jgi:sugar phosphate isomerase/epimerase